MRPTTAFLVCVVAAMCCGMAYAGQILPVPFDGIGENVVAACADVLQRNPLAVNGEYDLGIGEEGLYEDVHTACDFTTDSRVWARVSASNGTTSLYETHYQNGLDEGANSVVACTYLPADGLFRVNMGNVQDYYRPDPNIGATSCSMLQSSSSHLWKVTGEDIWVNVEPIHSLGGSAFNYPLAQDGRQYLSFWGTQQGMQVTGGCCASDYENTAAWGMSFTMWVSELQIPSLDANVTPLPSSDTISLACDEQLPANSADGEYSLVVQNVLRRVRCEFSTGRTWARVAVADSGVHYGINDYALGRNTPEHSSDFVHPCAALPENGIILVKMGDVSDFFKPTSGQTMCNMLQGHDKHQWKRTDNGAWMSIPAYAAHLGGSTTTTPTSIDGRDYVSFWGSSNTALTGGCCHNTYTFGGAAWGQAFEMFVSEYIPGTDD